MRQNLELQVMSDLHFERTRTGLHLEEYPTFEIPRNAEYLVLAGDVGRATQENHIVAYRRFLKRQCDKFELVFLIGGNNEFKRASSTKGLEMGLATLGGFAKHPVMRGRLIFLENDRFDFDHLGHEVTILGCTLLSRHRQDQPNAGEVDSSIKGWNSTINNQTRDESLDFLQSQVE